MSDSDGNAAGAQSSDQEADSPAQSSSSVESRDGSADSGASSESSGWSDSLELEEEEGLQGAEIDLLAPRGKRRRAVGSISHDEGCMAQPSDTPGQQYTCLGIIVSRLKVVPSMTMQLL